jgi:hypothetical protein
MAVALLEKPRTAYLLELGHDAGHLLVDEGNLDPAAALARERQSHVAIVDSHVALQQRCRAAPALGPGIGLVAGPQAGAVDQGCGRCQYGAPVQGAIPRFSGRQVRGDRGPKLLQPASQPPQALDLARGAYFGPGGVIEVLLAVRLVAPDRLQMGMGVGRDAHVAPCRRDHQIGNALSRLGIAHGGAILTKAEATAAPHPRDRQVFQLDLLQAQPAQQPSFPGIIHLALFRREERQ